MKRRFGHGSLSVKMNFIALLTCLMCLALPFQLAQAALPNYQLVETFALPGGGGPFDTLNDGRIVTVVGTNVFLENSAGSRTFTTVGTLTGADFSSFGPAFVRVSKNGDRIAVGNGGGASFNNFKVGVFRLNNLSGRWFTANHFDAEWVNNRFLALAAGAIGSPSIVTFLDTNSASVTAPVNPVIINGIGGASGGITFDLFGNLYTGNGFTSTGPSDTGDVKAFSAVDWLGPLLGGPAINFETDGTLVVDVLSAASLNFDHRGNLLVAGGDFLGGTDIDFAAVVNGEDILAALFGGGPANPSNPNDVLKLNPDVGNPANFYGIQANRVRREVYVFDSSSPSVFVYRAP